MPTPPDGPDFTLTRTRQTGTDTDGPIWSEAEQFFRHKFSTWKYEDKDEEACRAFPLRELAPDAAAYFAKAGFLSPRDIRYLIGRLGLEVDPKDVEAFYDAFLAEIEPHPWVFPMLEVAVVGNRDGVKRTRRGTKTRWDKVGHTLSKLPLHKLGIYRKAEIEDYRHAFLIDEKVPVENWIAAFCQYAVVHYRAMSKELTDAQLDLRFKQALFSKPIVDAFERLEETTTCPADLDDPLVAIQAQVGVYKAAGEPVPRDLRRDLAKLISLLTSYLDADSPAEDFRRLSDAADLAAEIAVDEEVPEQADRADGILRKLEDLGIETRFDDLSDEQAEMLANESFAELLYELTANAHALPALQERLTGLEGEISAATQARQYDRLGPLAEDIQNVQRQIDAEAAMRAKITEACDMIRASDEAGFRSLFEDDLASIPTTSEPAGKAVAVKGEEEVLAEDIGPFPDEDETSLLEPEAGEIAANDEALVEATSAADDVEETAEPPVTSPFITEPGAAPARIEADAPDGITRETPPLGSTILCHLLSRDLIGIAADTAETLEANRHTWPIRSAILRVAAASRARLGDYGADTQSFLSLVGEAQAATRNNLEANMLFAATLRPAITQTSSIFRQTLSDYARGTLGPHLMEVAEAVAALGYDFPPDADVLAGFSGAQYVPQKQRLAEQISEWCKATAKKKARWHFTTLYLQHLVSPAGLIGKARVAIEADDKAAVGLARAAIVELSEPSDIEAHADEYASEINQPNAQLYAKGMEYLQRHLTEILDLFKAWIATVERDRGHGQASEERLRATVGNLISRLTKSRTGLAEAARHETLHGAVAGWLATQVDEALRALRGGDAGKYPTVEEGLSAERDLLPPALFRGFADPETRLAGFVDLFATGTVASPQEAHQVALEEGAFEVASRLADRFSLGRSGEAAAAIDHFAAAWREEIIDREQALKTLAKVDLSHQEEIDQHLSWCTEAVLRLDDVARHDAIDDLDDIPVRVAELDVRTRDIESHIRDDQANRIRRYRTDQNADVADALLAGLDKLTLETVEDRIAQLRDGKSTLTFEAELVDLVGEFTPGFVGLASGPGWPKTVDDFERALGQSGPLATDEGRRSAAVEFFRRYREISDALPKKAPPGAPIRAFFEDIGFENVKLSDTTHIGRSGSLRMKLNGTLRRPASETWFLPPSFGSLATSGFDLFLIAPDTLPEMIQKLLEPETPAILLLAGVADLAKRHGFAERLRAAVHPALLIDEALVAFAATRKETRARTIFECGLPYGRIEPYSPEANSVPKEMFFGRETEIRDIMSKRPDGCLVYGGRQLGKSALLTHIARTYHSPETYRIVLRKEVLSLGNSEPAAAIWTHLSTMLEQSGVVKRESRTAESVSRDIRDWLHLHPKGQIVCLFDETTHFMSSETREEYPNLSKLKALMEDTGRAFKVVFAGLHNVKRMFLQPNSPLAHLGRPICIGPLNRNDDDRRAAHDLVISPMRAAGFRFESIEAVEEILNWANYYPSLIQEFARGLLATLHGTGSGKAYRLDENGPLWPIDTKTLFKHRGFHQIEQNIRGKFKLTLELDPRYELIAYTLGLLNAEGLEHQALHTGFKASDLLAHAQNFWPETRELPSEAAFEVLLDELFDFGVLGRTQLPDSQQFAYCLGGRQVAAMLGSYDDIQTALLRLADKDPVLTYDRTIYRRRYAPTGRAISAAQRTLPYMPLADLQIERMLDPSIRRPSIVCGLEFLGLSKVGAALKHLADSGSIPGGGKDGITITLHESHRDIRRILDATGRASARRHALVYTPGAAQEAREQLDWLERQPSILDGRVRPILLMDAADAEKRALAIRRKDQTEFLSPWGAEMIRVHLQNIEKTEMDTPETRKRILKVSGGIPGDIIDLIDRLVAARDPDDVFAGWKSSLRPAQIQAFGEIGRALTILEDVEDPSAYDAMDDLLRGETGSDLVTLGPDLVATGILTNWNPKTKQLRCSALGMLLMQLTSER